eukprot:SAG22_NODE_1509_length_4263_cov_194.143612_2_plen_180_part_00
MTSAVGSLNLTGLVPRQLPALTEDEMLFFKREGYLVKRGALPLALCAKARDLLWSENTSQILRRDDASSWVGPLPEEDFEKEQANGNARSEYRWQVRSIGADPIMLDLIPHTCKLMAEQLLGEGTLRSTDSTDGGPAGLEEIGHKCRGIYCTLPGRRGRSPNGGACHTDGHPMSLGMVG